MQTRKYIALSELQPLRRVLLSKGFPEIGRILTLTAFLGLILIGWGLSVPAGIDDKLYAKSNLVTLPVWGLWWPLMVLIAVAFGRVWCMVCPLELLGRIGERIGSMLGIRPRVLPRWLRTGWFILVLYGIVQLLVAAVHLHRVPMYTALYLLFMLGLAVTSGVLFRPRAICRAFCPVGLLLKVYGRAGMFAVRPVHGALSSEPAVTAACRSGLHPGRLDKERGEDCIMCLDCLQADRSRSGMGLILRRPWARTHIGPRTADMPVTLFIMMVSGFVAYELSGFWPGFTEVFLWLPARVEQILGLPAGSGWLKGLWIIIGFPLLLWSVLGLIARPLLQIPGLVETWRRIAYPVSLFVLAGHMTKALEKLATWSGFLPHAMRDPSGVHTVRAMIDGTIVPPEAAVSPPVILLIGAALLFVAVFLLSSRMRIFTSKERASVCGDTAGRP